MILIIKGTIILIEKALKQAAKRSVYRIEEEAEANMFFVMPQVPFKTIFLAIAICMKVSSRGYMN